MEHYFNTLKMPQPTMAFTPDSSFPVTFAEKGIIRVKFTQEYKNLGDFTFTGGNAFNSVPDGQKLLFLKSLLEIYYLK